MKNSFSIPARFRGIVFMLLAALNFSLMGAAAKLLKGSLNAGQLVFWRNAIGLVFLLAGFIAKPPENKGGRFHLLLFRGLMGTIALYTLLYCILYIPLGTAMTYNLTSVLFIAIFSFLFFKEYHGRSVLFAVLLGFVGMLLIYKPGFSTSGSIWHFPWYLHAVGLLSGITSAWAYISVNRLTKFYDTRIIVLSFVGMGLVVPSLFMAATAIFSLPPDDVFFFHWVWPVGIQWFYVLWLGLTALIGQYFVTRAYGSEKAGVVASVGYSNIVFSLVLGLFLGDGLPDWLSLAGISCIIISGILISVYKSRGK